MKLRLTHAQASPSLNFPLLHCQWHRLRALPGTRCATSGRRTPATVTLIGHESELPLAIQTRTRKPPQLQQQPEPIMIVIRVVMGHAIGNLNICQVSS